jgi:hypothetical protein
MSARYRARGATTKPIERASRGAKALATGQR